MPFEEGNELWRQRSRHGRHPVWDDPEKLQEACYEYLSWIEQTPLEEAITYQGEVMGKPLPKMRAMTMSGLCVYLGITKETWRQYRERDGFTVVTKEIDMIMETQKFEGAAAGMLNPNIIARDLGLRDSKDVDVTSSDGSMSPSTLTKEEAKALLAKSE